MLTGYYAVWQPTKVNTGASFNLLQSPSFLCWSQAQVYRGLRCPVRLSGVWQEPGDRRRPREGDGEEGQYMRGSPSILPAFHPVYTAAIRSTGFCTAGWSAVCQGAPRLLPAGGVGSADREPSQVFSPGLARSARVRTVTRELKGNRAVSILWALRYGHANEHRKTFIRTRPQDCASPVALIGWGSHSDTPKSEVWVALDGPLSVAPGACLPCPHLQAALLRPAFFAMTEVASHVSYIFRWQIGKKEGVLRWRTGLPGLQGLPFQ